MIPAPFRFNAAQFDPPEPTANLPKERGAGSRGSSEKRIDFRLMILKKCKDELEKGTAALKAVKGWDAKEHTKGGKGGGVSTTTLAFGDVQQFSLSL